MKDNPENTEKLKYLQRNIDKDLAFECKTQF
jgi:hypothetical protein